MKFNPKEIKYIFFDVDGTLYNKQKEYFPGRGSIADSHNFLRYFAYQKAVEGVLNFADAVVKEYRKHIQEGTLVQAVQQIPEGIKQEYDNLVIRHGSNGKVFAHEFCTDSSFLARIINKIDFKSILPKDQELQNMINQLKGSSYKLGILTTEVYGTVEQVFDALGLSVQDFSVDTGTKYPIFCAENIANKKPSNEGFMRIIESTKPEHPGQILYVGDHIKKDVEAAMKNGLQAALITYAGNEKISYNKINNKEFVIIGKLTDLIDLLI